MTAYAQAPSLAWVHQYGGTDVTLGTSVAADDSGNVYAAGTFSGGLNLNLGSGLSPVTAITGRNVYITKVNAAGNLSWAKYFQGGTNTNYVNAVAVDDSGNVYAAGRFRDSMDFNPGGGGYKLYTLGTGSSAYDIFIAKLDASGNFVWAKQIGGKYTDMVLNLQLDGAGNIYAVGQVNDTVDFDPGPGVYELTGAGNTCFLLKLNNSGAFGWAKRIPGITQIKGLAVNKGTADLYAAVGFSSTLNLTMSSGSYTLVPDSAANILILKLDSSGAFSWVKQISSSKSCGIGGIALDKYGSIYLTGSVSGTMDFDPDPAATYHLTVTGTYKLSSPTIYPGIGAFVAKLDSAGSFQWASLLDANRSALPQNIAVEAGGKAVYTIGYFRDTIDLDPGTGTLQFTVGTEVATYVSKLDAHGNLGWGASFVSLTSATSGYGIATDKSGYVYTTGDFLKQVDFDPSATSTVLDVATTGTGGRDAWVQKLFDCDYMSDALTLSGPDTVCLGNTAIYEVAPVPGAVSYIWQLPNGWTGSSNTNTISTDVTGSGTLSVRVAGSCDTSLPQELQVVVRMVGVTIAVSGNVLSTTQNDYDSWQWFRNDTLINGATSATYTATANGDYSVVATKSGCSDTDHYLISNIAVHDPANNPVITVYPNPAGDVLYISSPVAVNVTLTGIEGREVLQAYNPGKIDISPLAKGVYLLAIRNAEGRLIKVENIVKR